MLSGRITSGELRSCDFFMVRRISFAGARSVTSELAITRYRCDIWTRKTSYGQNEEFYYNSDSR
jgi:hypothetical protein